jgi:hypothetical protein
VGLLDSTPLRHITVNRKPRSVTGTETGSGNSAEIGEATRRNEKGLLRAVMPTWPGRRDREFRTRQHADNDKNVNWRAVKGSSGVDCDSSLIR